jgi:hypothetical protein
MAKRLADINKNLNRAKNEFQNKARAEALKQQLTSTTLSPEQQIILHYNLGAELLNSGDNQAALLEFEWVEKNASAHGPIPPENKINLRLNQALCYMRMGEQINCLSNHNSDSCLFPIQNGGVHLWKEGSRQATTVLTNLLTEFPTNLSGRWLLNIAAMTLGDYPSKVPAQWLIPPGTFKSDYDLKRFTDVAAPAGLAVNSLSGGSVVEDLDGDNLLDVMTTSIGLEDQMLFFHNNGDGTFSDRTDSAGLLGLTGGLNMVTTDYNNDGFVDVLVLRGGWMGEEGKFPPSLLKNNGDGTFEDVTEAAGLLAFHPTQTAVWFDFDGDGWLDLFIGNESPSRESPFPCELYHNNKNGTFTEMAANAGLKIRGYVKAAVSGDFNNDGRPDLFLSFQGRPNLLFRNDGPLQLPGETRFLWRFTDVSREAGIQGQLYSFPAWFFDYDNDGWDDLFVAGYHIENVSDIAADYLNLPTRGVKAKLYHNRGNGSFDDATEAAGLNHVLHAMGSNFGDLDNDGWLDFYLGTGNPDLLTLIPNRMFRNNSGAKFQDVTTSGGFGNLQKGHGVSFADLDNDGDQDVFEKMGGAVTSDTYPNVLYQNPGNGNHWLKLRLVGIKANRAAIGARVKMTIQTPNGERRIFRTVGSGGSFGCNPLRLEIGLANATAIKGIEVRWPGSNTLQQFKPLPLDTAWTLTENEAAPVQITLKSFKFPTAVSVNSMHHHH